VAKHALLGNRAPAAPGGGTIAFVSPTAHSYHPDPVAREEAGTPAIVESIRAGRVFALKQQVGSEEIRRRESDFARRALASWGADSDLRILGNPALDRLAIVSLGGVGSASEPALARHLDDARRILRGLGTRRGRRRPRCRCQPSSSGSAGSRCPAKRERIAPASAGLA
jgi:selenocysteine lyase/cysteine desulfurase